MSAEYYTQLEKINKSKKKIPRRKNLTRHVFNCSELQYSVSAMTIIVDSKIIHLSTVSGTKG